MVRFNRTAGEAGSEHPAKVLALYEDLYGNLKALVHSVCYKMATNKEGPFGDSRLITHHRMEFNQNNGEPVLYSVPFTDIMHGIVAYEAKLYHVPLAPKTRSGSLQKQHTVMTILPRRQWARVFLEWMQELRHRRETVNGQGKHKLNW
jgi:hypothetical protein